MQKTDKNRSWSLWGGGGAPEFMWGSCSSLTNVEDACGRVSLRKFQNPLEHTWSFSHFLWTNLFFHQKESSQPLTEQQNHRWKKYVCNAGLLRSLHIYRAQTHPSPPASPHCQHGSHVSSENHSCKLSD